MEFEDYKLQKQVDKTQAVALVLKGEPLPADLATRIRLYQEQDDSLAWYVTRICEALRRNYAIDDARWLRLVRERGLVAHMITNIDCLWENEPDTSALWLKEFLERQGEVFSS